jgi:hypothetical protein
LLDALSTAPLGGWDVGLDIIAGGIDAFGFRASLAQAAPLHCGLLETELAEGSGDIGSR